MNPENRPSLPIITTRRLAIGAAAAVVVGAGAVAFAGSGGVRIINGDFKPNGAPANADDAAISARMNKVAPGRPASVQSTPIVVKR